VDGWAVTFGTAMRGLCPPRCTKCNLSMASVPITVLLHDGPLLCGFNVAIKGLSCQTDIKFTSRLRISCDYMAKTDVT